MRLRHTDDRRRDDRNRDYDRHESRDRDRYDNRDSKIREPERESSDRRSLPAQRHIEVPRQYDDRKRAHRDNDEIRERDRHFDNYRESRDFDRNGSRRYERHEYDTFDQNDKYESKRSERAELRRRDYDSFRDNDIPRYKDRRFDHSDDDRPYSYRKDSDRERERGHYDKRERFDNRNDTRHRDYKHESETGPLDYQPSAPKTKTYIPNSSGSTPESKPHPPVTISKTRPLPQMPSVTPFPIVHRPPSPPTPLPPKDSQTYKHYEEIKKRILESKSKGK